MPGNTQEIFFFFFCAPPVSKVSFLGLQYEAFKCNAKNQTLGWTVYFAFPTAAVKIKENKLQITRRGVCTLYSLFALMSLLGVAAPCWTCAAAKKKKSSPFSFQKHSTSSRMCGGGRGSSRKSAPSRPNSAHPEVNGPEGADWPRAPEPSRHTTGRGCWHPPVKRSLPAVFALLLSTLFFFFFYSFAHPTFPTGSHWNRKKKIE